MQLLPQNSEEGCSTQKAIVVAIVAPSSVKGIKGEDCLLSRHDKGGRADKYIQLRVSLMPSTIVKYAWLCSKGWHFRGDNKHQQLRKLPCLTVLGGITDSVGWPLRECFTSPWRKMPGFPRNNAYFLGEEWLAARSFIRSSWARVMTSGSCLAAKMLLIQVYMASSGQLAMPTRADMCLIRWSRM